MAISMTKADGVTVLTVTSDSKSVWPPLCQILRALCYNPLCCTVPQHLRREQISQFILGSLQITIGGINIGLGVTLLTCPVYLSLVRNTAFPIWLGILFIIFGISSILCGYYPSPCLVMLSVVLNFAGVAFAITGIVLYSVSMGSLGFWWDCQSGFPWYIPSTTASPSSPSPEEQGVRQACVVGQQITAALLRSILVFLVVMSVEELCLTISSSVFGIKLLRKNKSEETKKAAEPEDNEPLLEDVTNDFPA